MNIFCSRIKLSLYGELNQPMAKFMELYRPILGGLFMDFRISLLVQMLTKTFVNPKNLICVTYVTKTNF